MYFVIGLALSTFVLFVISTQISLYNELSSERFRFRYFELRDRLAMMVVKGKISEDSWEYKNIVDSLNFHINAVETMTIWKMVSVLTAYHMSPDAERRAKQRKIENEEVRRLMFDFLCVTKDLIRRNSRAQIKVIEYFNTRNVKPKPVVRHTVSKPIEVIDRIQDRMNALVPPNVAFA